MEEVPNDSKWNRWYHVVFYLGVVTLYGSLRFDPAFLNPAYLFGFSFGLILISISYFLAAKVANKVVQGGILSWPVYKHNLLTIILLILGVGLAGLFSTLMIISLI